MGFIASLDRQGLGICCLDGEKSGQLDGNGRGKRGHENYI